MDWKWDWVQEISAFPIIMIISVIEIRARKKYNCTKVNNSTLKESWGFKIGIKFLCEVSIKKMII